MLAAVSVTVVGLVRLIVAVEDTVASNVDDPKVEGVMNFLAGSISNVVVLIDVFAGSIANRNGLGSVMMY